MGNVLMGDDGLGPYVVHVFEAGYEVPEGVTVEDLGTPGLDLTPYIADLDHVIFVDTVRSEGGPGELRLYRMDEVLKHPPQPRVTPHDPGLKEALLSLRFSGRAPGDLLLVGVIPGPQRRDPGLSREVRRAVPAAVAEIVAELSRLGLEPKRRATPRDPDIWWEQPPGGGEES
jgi:hydrogenase maturation protease